MPSYMIDFAFKEVTYMAMNCSSRDIVHRFECFRGDSIEAWHLSFLQLVDGAFDFHEMDRFVNQRHAWLLLEEV